MFQRKGIQIQSSPMVEGRQIDLFDLYSKVVAEGGSENVRVVRLILSFPRARSLTWLGFLSLLIFRSSLATFGPSSVLISDWPRPLE